MTGLAEYDVDSTKICIQIWMWSNFQTLEIKALDFFLFLFRFLVEFVKLDELYIVPMYVNCSIIHVKISTMQGKCKLSMDSEQHYS